MVEASCDTHVVMRDRIIVRTGAQRQSLVPWLSVCILMAVGSHYRCAHSSGGWWQESGWWHICTTGGASSEHIHHGGGQPQGSKLALCTHVVTEAGRGQRLEWEGFRHLVSVNMKTWGRKKLSNEICRRSVAAVVSVGFFSSESCWGPLLNRPQGTMVTPAGCLILVALVLVPCLQASLYI